MNENKREELRRRVYNVLNDLVEEFEDSENVTVKEEDLQEAIEWFMIHNF